MRFVAGSIRTTRDGAASSSRSKSSSSTPRRVREKRLKLTPPVDDGGAERGAPADVLGGGERAGSSADAIGDRQGDLDLLSGWDGWTFSRFTPSV